MSGLATPPNKIVTAVTLDNNLLHRKNHTILHMLILFLILSTELELLDKS